VPVVSVGGGASVVVGGGGGAGVLVVAGLVTVIGGWRFVLAPVVAVVVVEGVELSPGV
jgi:hypothetical protein